jgi:hypothetical protein
MFAHQNAPFEQKMFQELIRATDLTVHARPFHPEIGLHSDLGAKRVPGRRQFGPSTQPLTLNCLK